MKARIIKLVSLCTMTAMFLFSNVANQETKAISVETEDIYSIESYAENIKSIYKEIYPESTTKVDDIIDMVT